MFDWELARVAAVQFARRMFPYLDAEDVAQEAMVSLLTDRSRVPDRPLAVRIVVARRGVDMTRTLLGRRVNDPNRTLVELDVKLMDQGPQPEQIMDIEDQLRAVLDTTGARSEATQQRHARLIQRVYVLGEKPGAVAKDEGISASELSRIVSAAKQRRRQVCRIVK